MQKNNAKELLTKYRKGDCTATEIALLESWYLDHKDLPSDLTSEGLAGAKNKVWSTLSVHNQQQRYTKLWSAIAVAATIVICVALGLIFTNNKKINLPTNTQTVAKIVPGGNKAVLTLADGTKISLTDVANGNLANQAGIIITKTKDGHLVYHANQTSNQSDQNLKEVIRYNTISTPRGGQYQIDLPDGTRAWLNAASSLRYPTVFIGNERKVELIGEGYFEVKHNDAMPFKVVSGHQVVEVLGTHFNINAYENESSIKTTLLKGSVKVDLDLKKGNKTATLKPGEQAVTQQNSIKVETVNTEDVIAWKNNIFVFNKEDLGSIMRKISRWYDVEVTCPPDLAGTAFTGTVSREKSIQETLKIMELTGTVHFKFEGRRITAMP